ncbi:MAG: hypothetical protein OXG13_04940 [Gemmatimonadaceae bacterium]|nr:hypothetical protein [Gemmatimonadaceae bacterium]
MLRSLIHYRRVHAATALAAAVCTAVLAGALVVGDSVRASLRGLTLDRLGRVEHAVVRDRSLRTGLAEELPAGTAPVLLRPGSAAHAGTGARAGGVQVLGVNGRFADLFPEGEAVEALAAFLNSEGNRPAGAREVMITESLARELSAAPGDVLLLSLQRPAEVNPEALFGRRRPEELLRRLRCEVAGVIPDRGPGRFALETHQKAPRTLFARMEELQRALGLHGRADLLLVPGPAGGEPSSPAALRRRLDEALGLSDLDLVLHRRGDHLALESRRFVLDHPLGESVLGEARRLGLPNLAVSTYLANAIDVGERSLPYSTVAALEADPPGSWGPVPSSGPGLVLNDWAASDLQAGAGGEAVLHYYAFGPREELIERRAVLGISGSVEMAGLGADPALTPDYPGIGGTDDISEWSAPFPVDLDRIRPRDEDYWDRYRAAPKAFLSREAGRGLFSSRFGELTSVRLRPSEGESLESAARRFGEALLEEAGSVAAGYEVRPLRAEGLAAAEGATDFGGLFLGFSLFLIAAAALLTGLLFRLGVEQRAGEAGLLLAAGFPAGAVRRRLMAEALVVAGGGCLLGLAGAAGYGWLMMAGLRTWWQAAVGTSALHLHLAAGTLASGALLSLTAVLAAMVLTLRRLGQTPARALLAGEVEPSAQGRGRAARVVAPAAALAALALIAGAAVTSTASPGVRAGLFFAAGALLLLAGLAQLSRWLRQPPGPSPRPGRSGSLAAAGARNIRRHPGRSLTAVSLVACAVFVIAAVGAHRPTVMSDGRLPPGAGGYSIVAESDLPVHGDLNDAGVRRGLGLPPALEESLEGARIVQLRSLPGEDVSCLNLYRPGRPRLLGAPPELIEGGHFPFASHRPLAPHMDGNPWRLLEEDLGPGVVAAVADANSAQWILHRGLGEEIAIEDAAGRPVRLRLVALLQRSILQSELLISEAAFERLFPERTGYGFFLVETPDESRASALIAGLERGLRDFGFDAAPTADRLARFLEIETTYLSTFQSLGGLGLLLGTAGLGLLLLRNAFERRRELAALQAFGFRRRRLARLLFWETGLLLLGGIGLGVTAAAVASLPHLGPSLPWASLGSTLGLVLAAGWLGNAAAVRLALRRDLLPALKGE